MATNKKLLESQKEKLAEQTRKNIAKAGSREAGLALTRQQLKDKGIFDTVQERYKTGKEQEKNVLQDAISQRLKTQKAVEAQQASTTAQATPTREATTGQIQEEDVIVSPEVKDLRTRVAEQVASKQTREESLKQARTEAGRDDLVEQGQFFREEASRVQEDIENITKGLEAEGGAITNIAASRIREARSAPLRETLTSLVRGQELTTANLQELDNSIAGILEARRLDREDRTATLANQIETSTLPASEKQALINQLGVQTEQSKRRDEMEAFQQQEQIKADIARREAESVAQTGLSLQGNITLGKILNNFGVKEDSLVGKSVAGLIREGKSEQEINKILGLATDSEGNFIDDTQFARREKLRKEFESKAGVKAYREAVLQHQGTIATLGQASGPGDVAAVFQFMKTLDPTSVVRESEFEQAANAAGVLEQVNIGNVFEKFKNGAILGEQDSKTREAFVKTVNKLFEVKKDNYDTLARQMINQALRDGVDPNSVILDLNEVPGASNLTGQDFNLLQDDDFLDIDTEFGFTTSGGKTYNIDAGTFKNADTTAGTNSPVVYDSSFVGPLPKTAIRQDLIAKYPNEAAFKNNNPTGITFGISARSKKLLDDAGVKYTKGTPRPAREGGNYFAFQTVADGMKAYETLLTKASFNDVYSRLKQWVGTSEGPTYAKNLMAKAGISMGETFSSLSKDKLNRLMKAQLQKESPNFYKEIIA